MDGSGHTVMDTSPTILTGLLWCDTCSMASSRPPIGVEKAAARPAAVPMSTQSRWPASVCEGPAHPRGSRTPNAAATDLGT